MATLVEAFYDRKRAARGTPRERRTSSKVCNLTRPPYGLVTTCIRRRRSSPAARSDDVDNARTPLGGGLRIDQGESRFRPSPRTAVARTPRYLSRRDGGRDGGHGDVIAPFAVRRPRDDNRASDAPPESAVTIPRVFPRTLPSVPLRCDTDTRSVRLTSRRMSRARVTSPTRTHRSLRAPLFFSPRPKCGEGTFVARRGQTHLGRFQELRVVEFGACLLVRLRQGEREAEGGSELLAHIPLFLLLRSVAQGLRELQGL